MEYLKIENGIITAHYAGDMVDEDCIPLDGEFWGAVGEPVEWYDKEWKRIDDITLYDTGVKQIPEGMKFNDEHTDLVEMDEEEKIIAGVKPLPFGQRVVDGKLEPIPQRELWLDGLISDEDYEKQKRMERDSKLSSTDKYMIPDFPVTEEYREVIKVYRQTLRDLPESEKWPDVEIPDMPNSL